MADDCGNPAQKGGAEFIDGSKGLWEYGLWEQGLPAIVAPRSNSHNALSFIAGKPCSHNLAPTSLALTVLGAEL